MSGMLHRGSISTQSRVSVKYISQEEAINIENELLNKYKFSADQITELFGLGTADALHDAYPLEQQSKRTCLFVIGTGFNGGQGLVCARHLKQYGYSPVLYIHKQLSRPLFINLKTQCELMEIPSSTTLPMPKEIDEHYDFVVDALYGNNFVAPIRPDGMHIIKTLKNISVPICSIDVPSGWNVNRGCPKTDSFQPEILVSHIAPKLCAMDFHGRKHYLTGHFIPPILQEKYNLNLPEYPGYSLSIKLTPQTTHKNHKDKSFSYTNTGQNRINE